MTLENLIELPGVTEEGTAVVGTFTGFAFPYGTIGPWAKGDFNVVRGYDALPIAQQAGIAPDAYSKRETDKGDFYVLYYTVARKGEADEVAKLLSDKSYGSNLITQFACDPTQTLPNPSQYELMWDIDKKALAGRNGEAFNLVTIVSIVKAYADLQGWETPDIGFHDISDPKNAAMDEIEAKKLWDHLLLQRKELWEALGEDEVFASHPTGAVDGRGKLITGKVVSKSEKLSSALRFANSAWRGNFYASVGRCGHPSGKGSIPTVLKLFRTKADAEKYLEERANRNAVVASHEDADLGDSYAGLHVMDGLSAEEFAGALMSEFPKLLDDLNAASGVKKVQLQKAFDAKLVEYDLTAAQWGAWKSKLGLG